MADLPTQSVSAFDLIQEELAKASPIDAMKIIGQELYGVADPVIRGFAGEQAARLGHGAVNFPGTLAGAGLAATNAPAGFMRGAMNAGDRVVGAMENPVGLINALDEAGNTFASSPLHSLNMPMAPVGSLMAAMQAAKGANLPSAGVADQAFAVWQQTPQGMDAMNMAEMGNAVFDPVMQFFGQKADEQFPQGTDTQANPMTLKNIVGTAVENVPQMAAQMGAAALTGGGSAAARALAFGVSSFPMEAGSAMQEGVQGFQRQGLSREQAIAQAAPSAVLQGLANAGLEQLSGLGIMDGAGDLLKKVAPGVVAKARQEAAKKIIEQELRGVIEAGAKAPAQSVARKLAGRAIQGAVSEGATETLQEGVNIAGEAMSGSNPKALENIPQRLALAGLAGGVLGGGAGGLASLVNPEAEQGGVFTPEPADFAQAGRDGPGSRLPAAATLTPPAPVDGQETNPASPAEAAKRMRSDEAAVETPDHPVAGILTDAMKAKGISVQWVRTKAHEGMYDPETRTVFVDADSLNRKGTFGQSLAWETVIDEATHDLDATNPDLANEIRQTLPPRVLQQAEQSYVNRFMQAYGVSDAEARRQLGPEVLREEALGTALQMGMADAKTREALMSRPGLFAGIGNKVRGLIEKVTESGRNRNARIEAFNRFWDGMAQPTSEQMNMPLTAPLKPTGKSMGSMRRETGATPPGSVSENAPLAVESAAPASADRSKLVSNQLGIGRKVDNQETATPAATLTGENASQANPVVDRNMANPGAAELQRKREQFASQVDSQSPTQRTRTFTLPKTLERKGKPQPGSEFPERPALSKPAAVGKTRPVQLADGRALPAKYAVIEASDLIPTHDPNAGFAPMELGDANERPYEHANEGKASRETVRAIAENPDVSMILNNTPTPTDGPPIVSDDFRVLGGNARSMGILTKYGQMPERAEQYRTALKEEAAAFGIDPSAIDGFERPILVRQLQQPAGKRGELSRVLNDSMTTAKTVTTEAISRGSKLSLEDADAIAGVLGEDTLAETLSDPARSDKVLQVFVRSGALSQQDLVKMRESDGKLTSAAKELIEDALLGSAIGDVAALSAATADVKAKLAKAVPSIIRIKAAGNKIELDISSILADAMEALNSFSGWAAKTNGKSFIDFLRQGSMLPEPWRDNYHAMMLANSLRDMTQTAVAKGLKDVANAAMDQVNGEVGLMGEPTGAREMFEQTFGRHNALANILRRQVEKFSIGGWHGTPHEFDRFSTSKIGTGEGAQAYGWGLYFAGKKEVAEWYREKLAGQNQQVYVDGQRKDESADAVDRGAAAWLLDVYTPNITMQSAINRALGAIQVSSVTSDGRTSQFIREVVERLNQWKQAATEVRSVKGRLYQVELSPNEDELLDWDTQLSQQSTKVRNAIGKVMSEIEAVEPAEGWGSIDVIPPADEMTGRQVYDTIKFAIKRGRLEPSAATQWIEAKADQHASMKLKEAGIPGIRYLDGSSRQQRAKFEFASTEAQDNARAEFGSEPLSRGKQWADVTLDNNYGNIDKTIAELKQRAASGHGNKGPDIALKLIESGAIKPADRNSNYVIFDDKDVQIKERFNVAPPVDSEAFRKWFGNSKVVDLINPVTGKPVESSRDPQKAVPKVVYHGTGYPFTQFSIPSVGKNSGTFGSWPVNRFAAFFAEDPKLANVFAEQHENVANPSIVPVYLSVQNPIDLTTYIDEQVLDALEAKGLNSRYYRRLAISEMWEAFDEENEGKQFVEALQDLGYDGAMLAEAMAEYPINSAAWVVFKPTQIKSATGNAGTFDPSNPDIRFNVAPDPEKQAKSEIIGTDLFGRPIKAPIRGMQMPLIDTVDHEKLKKEEADKEWKKRRPGETAAEHKARLHWSSPEIVKNNMDLPFGEKFSIAPSDSPQRNLVAFHNTTERGILGAVKLGGMPMPSIAITKDTIPFHDYGNITLIGTRSMVDPQDPTGHDVQAYDGDTYSGRMPEQKWKINTQAVKALRDRIMENPQISPYNVTGNYYNSAFYIQHWLDDSLGFDNFVRHVPESLPFLALYASENGIALPKPPNTSDHNAKSDNARKVAQTLTNRIVKAGHKEKFRVWVNDLAESLKGDSYFLNKRGSKRDFTLDEIMAYMRTSDVRGKEQTMVHGLGKARALGAKKFRNIEQMRQASDRLVTSDEERKAKDETSKKFHELTELVVDAWPYTDTFSGRMDMLDALSEAVGKVIRGDRFTPLAMRQALRSTSFTKASLDEPTIQSLLAFAKQLQQSVTDYFEAKPQRAVKLKEFAAAVIPESTSPEVREILQQQVGHVETYKTNTYEERHAAVRRAIEAVDADKQVRFNVAPVTDSEAFRKWFGDSKVVDAEGKPLAVYHGTPSPKFERFALNPKGGMGGPLGMWFASTGQAASQFATKRFSDQGPAVYPVFLSIQNPLEFKNWQDFVERVRELAAGKPLEVGMKSMRLSAMRKGQDGVVIRNSDTDNGGTRDDWVAFRPTQIKSATGNRGTFDPSNPDIRFNVSPDPDKVRTRQSMIESEAAAGQQTLGRPDLANPVDPAAEDGKARRLVDAVDQVRTDMGVPATRSDKDVQKQADDRLKADWAGERARLLEVVKAGGQLNDVDTLVATRIVNKAAIDAISFGDTAAYRDAVILASAYRDTGTEQARAFRQRRDQFLTPAERVKSYLAEAIVAPSAKDKAKMERLQQQLQATSDDADQARIATQIEAMATQQAKEAQLIATKVRAQGISLTSMSDAQLADPAVASQVARAVSTAKASKMDKAQEYWINSILSALPTHGANIIGNAASVSWEIFGQRALEAAANSIPGLRSKDGATFGEYAAMMKGLGPAFQHAARSFLRSFVTERPAFEDLVKGNGVQLGLRTGNEHYKSGAIEGKAGRVVRVPTRALLAEDQFFKAIAGTLETYAAAHRMAKGQGLKGKAAIDFANRQISDFTSHAWATGLREADRLTFQQELGKVANLALTAKREVPALAFVIPFVTTPVNIFKAAIAKTPVVGDVPRIARLLAGAGSAINMKWRGKAGGYVYTKRTAQRDLANAVVAWGVTLALWSMVGADDDRDEPMITGNRSRDRGVSAANQRGANPPLSIRIGDKWVSYARIEPFATQLGIIVDGIRAAKRAKDTSSWMQAMGGMANSLVNSVNDKTFLKGLGDIMDAFANRDQKGGFLGRWAVNFTSSWVPNIVRYAQTSASDTVPDLAVRETQERSAAASVMQRAVQRSFPMLDQPMPKVDVWGRDADATQIQGSPRTDYVYRMLLPVQMVPTDRELQVDRLLVNWNNQVENDPTEQLKAWWPTPPSNQVEKKGLVVYRMSDAEYADFLREAGQAAHKRVQALIDAKVLSVDQPTQKHIDRIQKIREEEYRKAREKLGTKAR